MKTKEEKISTIPLLEILAKYAVKHAVAFSGAESNAIVEAMYEYASEQTKKYKELCVAINDYATFLGKQLDVNATFLWIHGVSATKEDIQKGAELRDKIEQLKKELPLNEK